MINTFSLIKTDLKITGASGFGASACVPITKGLTIGGAYTRLFVENARTGDKAMVSGDSRTIEYGKGAGLFKYINLSGSLDFFPAGGSYLYQGPQAPEKGLSLGDLAGPATILTGTAGTLSAGSAGVIIWPSSCEVYWSDFEKLCDCVKGNVVSLIEGTKFHRTITHAKAIGTFYAMDATSSPKNAGISMSDVAFRTAIIN